MIRKALLVCGLMVIPFACSDDQQEEELEEPVQMPIEEEPAAFEPEPETPDLTEAPEPPAVPEAPVAVQAEGEGSNYPPLFVRCAVLRVRTGPGMGYPTTGYVTFNTEVFPLEQNSKWVKIGQNKYVSRHFLSTAKNSKQYIPAH